MEEGKKRILSHHLPDLTREIDPQMLLPHLPCLSTASKEEVDAAQNSKSRTYAAMKLHEHLIRRPEGWSELIKALRHPEIGHGHLADKLEPSSSQQQQQQQQQQQGIEEEHNYQQNILFGENRRLTSPDIERTVISTVNVDACATSPRRYEGDTPVRCLNNGVVRIMRALDYSGLKQSDDLAEYLGFTFQQVNELRATAENGNLATALFNEYAKREDATLRNLMTILRDQLGRLDIVGDLESLTGFKLPPLPETPKSATPPDQRPSIFQASPRESEIPISSTPPDQRPHLFQASHRKSPNDIDETKRLADPRPGNPETTQSTLTSLERSENANSSGRKIPQVFMNPDAVFKSNGSEHVSTMNGVFQENMNRIPQCQPSYLTTRSENNESIIDASKQLKHNESVFVGGFQNSYSGQLQKYSSNDAGDLAKSQYPNSVNGFDSYTDNNLLNVGELDGIIRVQYIRQESQPPGQFSPAPVTSPPVCHLAKTEKESTIMHCLATSSVRQDVSLALPSTGNPRPLHGTDSTEVRLPSSCGGQSWNEPSGEMSSILRKGEKDLSFLRTDSLENNTDSDVCASFNIDSDTNGISSLNDKQIGDGYDSVEACASGEQFNASGAARDDIRSSEDLPQIESGYVNEKENDSNGEVKEHRSNFCNTVPLSFSTGTCDSSTLSPSFGQDGTREEQTLVPDVNVVRAELHDQDDSDMTVHETIDQSCDPTSDSRTVEDEGGRSASLFSGIARGVMIGTAVLAICLSQKGGSLK